MTKEFDYSPIDKILENHEKTAVIAILQDIQEIYHYLPKEIFPYLAKKAWHRRSKNIQRCDLL